jgi:predicted hydrolase (HD superfamily)
MAPTSRLTDDSLRVRQLSHYQFSWTAGQPGKAGTWSLQLVLDEGAWEEVLSVTAEDADNLQDVLKNTKNVFYDIDRRVLMFGVTKAGD